MDILREFFFDIIIVFLLVFFNALFVAIEYSIIRVRNSEIASLIEKGDKKALALKSIKQNIDRFISAAQLGITAINLLLGWIGEDFFTKIFNPLFKVLGIDDSTSGTISFILGIALITYFTVSFGELAPKVFAIRFSKNIALWLAYPFKLFYGIFKPFIWILNKTAMLFLKLFGIQTDLKEDIVQSEEELRYIIAEGRKTGVIDSTEHQLIEKIIDFNDKTADDIMVPRNNMVAIDIESSRDKIIQTIIDEGYSRLPVYKDDIDNIIGIIYSKDLISAAEHKGLIVLQDILRPVHFVPENKHIGEILKDFQKKRIHIGIVINEHGEVVGLITLEDIIEEIVGEIEDEYDVETRNIEKDKLGIFLVNPEISIEDFNKKFNTDIPLDTDEYHTLSGFLQTVTGHIPDIYERIDYKGIIFTIMKKSGNKLLQVKIQRMI